MDKTQAGIRIEAHPEEAKKIAEKMKEHFDVYFESFPKKNKKRNFECVRIYLKLKVEE